MGCSLQNCLCASSVAMSAPGSYMAIVPAAVRGRQLQVASTYAGHLSAGYTKWDHKRNEDVMEELQLEPVINHVKHYQNNRINHLHRMHRDRIPKVMLHYRPNGKRSLGRPKKRWIENSTQQQPQLFTQVAILYPHSNLFLILLMSHERLRTLEIFKISFVRDRAYLLVFRTEPIREVEKLKYLGATVTNINDTRKEIKRRINMGNACYYSVEKLLSSSLLSKNLKVRIYKTVILPVVLYGCETWTLTLREE
ncbi:hypothetical protein ANN_05874 [Periplaneta americana]|uniref:Uncharacterized protein n=1 Tax=Periplaneta americana TaxID=6978 RepID=A0ABQ8TC07_PERAM|nr:hypothetical protein ANN_05874 [Periplaneta americana]